MSSNLIRNRPSPLSLDDDDNLEPQNSALSTAIAATPTIPEDGLPPEDEHGLPPTPMSSNSKLHIRNFGPISSINIQLLCIIFVWYAGGVLCIVTSKLMLMHEFALPPLVLTVQQLILGSTLIRFYLMATGNLQPVPKTESRELIFAGLFNSLDFLASATSFSHSSASFVETMKSSEPVTTTAIALFFGIDRLRTPEAISLVVLVSGVLCSTIANVEAAEESAAEELTPEQEEYNWRQSVKTCVIVMTANICFALRAKSQKLYRASPEGQVLDDSNLLMRMQQIGAVSLMLPLLVFESQGILARTLESTRDESLKFYGIALVNATAFSSYCVASCIVLTKMSVMRYTGLNSLRRMFAIIATSVMFGVPITPLGLLGILMCFGGFVAFTHYRNSNPPVPKIPGTGSFRVPSEKVPV